MQLSYPTSLQPASPWIGATFSKEKQQRVRLRESSHVLFAISSSSFVGMTKAATRDPRALIRASPFSFAAASRVSPSQEQPFRHFPSASRRRSRLSLR